MGKRQQTTEGHSKPRWAPGRVLLVDDDKEVRESIGRLLTYSGAEVFEAPDALHALTILPTHGPFDVVLTDQHMPGMAGTELARVVDERMPGLPVVLMTGRQEVLSPHVAAVVRKPFSLDLLLETLRRLSG